MNQILVTIPNIEHRPCANFECKNRLTDYELEKLEKHHGYSRYYYCRNCRFLFSWGKILVNRCRDCGRKVDSYKIVCKYCRLENKNGIKYVDRKCKHRYCNKIISKDTNAKQKYCSKSHRNSELQMQYRGRK